MVRNSHLSSKTPQKLLQRDRSPDGIAEAFVETHPSLALARFTSRITSISTATVTTATSRPCHVQVHDAGGRSGGDGPAEEIKPYVRCHSCRRFGVRIRFVFLRLADILVLGPVGPAGKIARLPGFFGLLDEVLLVLLV